MSAEKCTITEFAFEEWAAALLDDEEFTTDEAQEMINTLRVDRELWIMSNEEMSEGTGSDTDDEPAYLVISRHFPLVVLEAGDDLSRLMSMGKDIGAPIFMHLYQPALFATGKLQ